MAGAAILALGHSLPVGLVTNEDLAARLGVDAEGAALGANAPIQQRYYVEPGLGPSDLAREATTMALARAGLAATDLDFLVFATMTPDMAFPGSGCFLQDKLGVPPIGALDIRAQCAGFLFGLVVAERLLASGAYRHILLAAAEVHSTSLDFSPAGAAVTPFFGDGGAVAILGAGDGTRGVLASVLHTDATDYERFWCEFPASRKHPVRITVEDLRAGKHYPRVSWETLNPMAARLLQDVVGEVLAAGGLAGADIDHYFLHYIDPTVALETARTLGLSRDRVTVSAERAGHIAAASLPISLSQAWASGAVRTGDLVCLAAVGAGINWGAVIVRL